MVFDNSEVFYRRRCPKCYTCPKCQGQLIAKSIETSQKDTSRNIVWNCFGCEWNSEQCDLVTTSILDLQGVLNLLTVSHFIGQTCALLRRIEEVNRRNLKDAVEVVHQNLCIPLHTNRYDYYRNEQNLDGASETLMEGRNAKKAIVECKQQLDYQSTSLYPRPMRLRSTMRISCRNCSKRQIESPLLQFNTNPLCGDSSM